jgi:hypothetical protein
VQSKLQERIKPASDDQDVTEVSKTSAKRHRLTIPPNWVVPRGLRLQVPLALASGENAEYQLLITGLEPGASIPGAVEIVAGTWMIDSDKLDKVQLRRGASPSDRAPLTIELRSMTGEVIEQHHLNLLTSESAGDRPDVKTSDSVQQTDEP